MDECFKKAGLNVEEDEWYDGCINEWINGSMNERVNSYLSRLNVGVDEL